MRLAEHNLEVRKRSNGSDEREHIGIKMMRILIDILACVLIFLCSLITATILWMFRTWAGLTINELMFQIRSPINGTDPDIIWSFIWSSLVAALAILALVIVLHRVIKKGKAFVYPAALLLGAAAAFCSVRYMWNRLEISAYNDDQSTYSTFIDENYVAPNTVNITFPEKKRNLIYIFLESMENTYSDEAHGGAFEEDVIPELTELSMEYENFSGDENILNGGVSFKGTTWTVGAMFGQTSGLPLLIPISSNKMSTQEEFFPGITSLGDILEKEGYRQSVMFGSDAAFGGRDLYFSQHGNYELFDYYYSKENQEIPDDYYVFWGYEDNRLFENAKKHLLEISQSDQPFNFTMLTVDTHFEDGYVCEDCPDTFGDDQYANVMACSSKKVTEFVAWLQEQDFYENTTIVISGDHPTMDSDFCEDVDESYQRKVYTTYINADAQVQNKSYREYSTLDNFPTTLASLGVEIEGNRLGLGTNLFSGEATLIEKYDFKTVDTELGKQSKLMDELTSDIDVEAVEREEAKKEEEQQEEQILSGEISVTPYDFRTGKFDVLVQNLNPPENVQAIRCAIWSAEDQSDLKWYEAGLQEDGSYIAKIWAEDFGYKRGAYRIHVYAVNENGESVFIGEATGEI